MRFAGEEYSPVASGGKRISNVTGASVLRGGPAKKISDMSAKVGVIMGSTSDWEVMAAAAETLEAFGIPYEKRVVSAPVPPTCWSSTPRRRAGAASRSSSPVPAGRPICRAWWPA